MRGHSRVGGSSHRERRSNRTAKVSLPERPPPAKKPAGAQVMAMEMEMELRRLVAAEFARAQGVEGQERLPSEVEEGNVEYKLQLLEPTAARLTQLTTQLLWRLNEGRGTAFYELGVCDDGDALGLRQDALLRSLATLGRMCQVANAEMSVERFRDGHQSHLRAARVRVTRILEKSARAHVRVSVIGDVESGKSTLIGVITRGCLDDGDGLARMQVFRHRHEIENGRTSSISEHTIGVTPDGRFCCADDFDDFGDGEFSDDERADDDDFNAGSSSRKAAADAATRYVTLSDLAGHKKYFKVTASGLASQFPDYAMLVVDTTSGVQPMTREHLRIAAALEVAVFVVLTKTDLVNADRRRRAIDEVSALLLDVCPTQGLAEVTTRQEVTQLQASVKDIPLFDVSSVDGTGLDLVQAYLAALEPKRIWPSTSASAPEFQINEAYDIEDTGTVVSGLVQSGSLSVGDTMLLGPDSDGQFSTVTVESIEVQRRAVPVLAAGETGALLLQFQPGVELCASRIRKGTMLIHPSVHPRATRQFDAEVHFLTDASAIRENNYQAVIHAGQVRQMARLVRLLGTSGTSTTASTPAAACGPPATTLCRFEFMYWPEYMRPDLPLVLREGNAQGVGRVVRAVDFGSEQKTSVRSC